MYVRKIPILLLIILLISLQKLEAKCAGTNCTCGVSAIGVNFGSYNPFSAANVDGTATVTVTCSTTGAGVVSYALGLSAGSGTFALRKMINGANQITYNLYSDAAHSQIWGDGTSGTSVVTDTYMLILNSSRTINYTVYGRVTGSQNVAVGTYTDTITVTLVF